MNQITRVNCRVFTLQYSEHVTVIKRDTQTPLLNGSGFLGMRRLSILIKPLWPTVDVRLAIGTR